MVIPQSPFFGILFLWLTWLTHAFPSSFPSIPRNDSNSTLFSKSRKNVHYIDLYHHPLRQIGHEVAKPRFFTYDALRKDNSVKSKVLPTKSNQLVKSGILSENDSILISPKFQKSGLSRFASKNEPLRDICHERYDHAWDLHVGWVENARSDSEFLLEIAIGTPAQKFLASVDTASPLLWVYSEICCYAGNHSFFKPENSLTFANRTLDKDSQPIIAGKGIAPQQYKLQYGGQGSGSIENNIGFDTVNIMPSSDGIQVKSQTIGLVQSITNATRGSGRDLRGMEALLGLGPGNATSMPGKLHTPIEELIINGKIDEPMFTVSFVKSNGTQSAKGGRLIIGGLDEERTVGEITWIPSTSNLFWGFEFEKGAMKYGNVDIWPDANFRRVIIDTGSSGIYLPDAAAEMIHEDIAGSYYDETGSRWLIPCQTGRLPYEKSLNSFTRARYFSVNLGGRLFAIPTIDLVLFPLNPIGIHTVDENEVKMCNSAIQGGSESFAVLGNTFIKNHAITFKYGGKDLLSRQLGFAHRKDTGIILDALDSLSRVVSPDDSVLSIT